MYMYILYIQDTRCKNKKKSTHAANPLAMDICNIALLGLHWHLHAK